MGPHETTGTQTEKGRVSKTKSRDFCQVRGCGSRSVADPPTPRSGLSPGFPVTPTSIPTGFAFYAFRKTAGTETAPSKGRPCPSRGSEPPSHGTCVGGSEGWCPLRVLSFLLEPVGPMDPQHGGPVRPVTSRLLSRSSLPRLCPAHLVALGGNRLSQCLLSGNEQGGLSGTSCNSSYSGAENPPTDARRSRVGPGARPHSSLAGFLLPLPLRTSVSPPRSS